jgi:hypothetical protein|tara:strand:- start:2594 stop:2809 length:216 start_codon:yes stop_codon:yes gene_type:complete
MSIAKRLIEEELDELDEIYEAKLVLNLASSMPWPQACLQMDNLIKSSLKRDDLSKKDRIEMLAAWERIQRG